MSASIPDNMKAAVIEQFGGLDKIKIHTLPVPVIGADEVLIRIESAGVGVWDVAEREGIFARMYDGEPKFPHVLGSEGAGTIVAVGDNVSRLHENDKVYAVRLGNPKGGFYAEYVAVKANSAMPVPEKLTVEQASVMGIDAITALNGLNDTLGLKKGESVMIFGASGGIGHLAIQMAKRMGTRVLAIASGDDGAALAQQLGADAVVEGHAGNVAVATREFGPDAALLTASGEVAEKALAMVRKGGRAAYPKGVRPEPKAPPGIKVQSYSGLPDQRALEKLNHIIESGPFEVHVAHGFPLDQAANAQRALDEHYLGKLALQMR